jgi:hypothetical protein
VIGDSIPWKDELLRVAGRIERKKPQKRWPERSMFLLERDVMVSAYAVRKLIEARKVSDELSAQTWPVRRHGLRGAAPDAWNRHEVEEVFDLEKSLGERLASAELCNQIIHSWIWAPYWTWAPEAYERDLLAGIYVASDRKRRECLYSIDIDVVIELFRSVGSEEVVRTVMGPDANSEWRILRVQARER